MTAQAPSARRSAADRFRSASRDLRTLGVGAPLRAAYEASKRLGGHALIFRRLVPTASDVPHGRSPFSWPTVPDDVRSRTIEAADRIASGTVEVFGRDLDVGDAPDWHALIETPGAWPKADWWQIDIRSSDRPGDVKWAWELGRHRHLVILARAAHLEPSNDVYRTVLERHLEAWITQNAPEVGVHWYSNLEIALRSITWLQILALAGDQLSPELRSAMWRHLHHSGRHLVADLPYTVSTMRNNHLLGDALGLIALGRAFGGRPGARWYSIGDRLFDRQVARHVRSDGSMIEDSVSYHRFVLEMLSMRVVLGEASPRVHQAMERAAQFLARLGVLEGPVPQYGDWDEGRLLAVADDPSRLEGSLLLALALAGDGAPADWKRTHDEVAWFAPGGAPQLPEPAETRGREVGGGIGRAKAGPWVVWLKAGSGPSHGHADLSSIAIAVDGQWLIGDPGTGAYNGPIEMRNQFRSSAAHNVVRVEGVDQLEPHRVFRWKHTALGVLGDPVDADGSVAMWCAHDAYTRLNPPHQVARVVSVAADGVTIRDFISGPPTDLSLSIQLGPKCVWDGDRSVIGIGDGRFAIGVKPTGASSSCTELRPMTGEWSSTYGSTAPSTVVSFDCGDATSLGWAVALPGSADQPNRSEPNVAFTGNEARLSIDSSHGAEVRAVEL